MRPEGLTLRAEGAHIPNACAAVHTPQAIDRSKPAQNPKRRLASARAIKLYTRLPRRTRSSAGEHYVDIVGVAGSIPAASTIFSMT
jgi:hypothetical protein